MVNQQSRLLVTLDKQNVQIGEVEMLKTGNKIMFSEKANVKWYFVTPKY